MSIDIFHVGEEEDEALSGHRVYAGDIVFDRETGELAEVKNTIGRGDENGRLQFVVLSDSSKWLVGIEEYLFTSKFGIAALKIGKPNLSIELNDYDEEGFFEGATVEDIQEAFEEATNEEMLDIFNRFKRKPKNTEENDDDE